ncbi:hypothetical protein BOS5A_210843 [Bosea sp. EC-HK365B]|nr:hypothetical protein BOSE7B_120703 [Bosea sp. 7B]VVT60052.1 hypothetical protein BOS5A_210843 [Bosea sp. EC-HK365B]
MACQTFLPLLFKGLTGLPMERRK